VGSCEQGNKTSVSIKFWEILEQLNGLAASRGLSSIELVNIPSSIQGFPFRPQTPIKMKAHFQHGYSK
jgi:hypothetical protein